MGMSNFDKSVKITTDATVLNSAATPLATKGIAVQNSDSLDVYVEITTVGSMTDLRVRPFSAHVKNPGTFTGVQDADWAPLATETITSGAAVQDPYEASYAAATWFSADGKLVHFRIPSAGTHMAFALYDGAGVGTSSVVSVNVYHRRV